MLTPDSKCGLGESGALLMVSLLGIKLKILSKENGIIRRSPTMPQGITAIHLGAFFKSKRSKRTASTI